MSGRLDYWKLRQQWPIKKKKKKMTLHIFVSVQQHIHLFLWQKCLHDFLLKMGAVTGYMTFK